MPLAVNGASLITVNICTRYKFMQDFEEVLSPVECIMFEEVNIWSSPFCSLCYGLLVQVARWRSNHHHHHCCCSKSKTSHEQKASSWHEERNQSESYEQENGNDFNTAISHSKSTLLWNPVITNKVYKIRTFRINTNSRITRRWVAPEH